MTPQAFRAHLTALGWSGRQLAEALGCSRGLVSQWASGRCAIPSDVAKWLSEAALWHQAHPPPQGWQYTRDAA
jgi:transcriptional regulator with XRE-family HTH domain